MFYFIDLNKQKMEGKEPKRKVLGRVTRYVRRSSLLQRGPPEHPDTPPEDTGPGFDTLPAEVSPSY
jgi:hypothetical protein